MIKDELEKIRKKHRGILRPIDVIEFAKNPDTELHSKFEWDESKAAHQYRLEQAREIIRTNVIVLEGTNEPIQAYVSLLSDRKNKNGGYRDIITVMSDDELRKELLTEAMTEFKRFEQKYKLLKELEPLFSAAKKIK